MKSKPILFSGAMIRAVLEGSKTQTRRIYKSKLPVTEVDSIYVTDAKCPYGDIGGRLWVKEAHYLFGYWIRNGLTKKGKQKYKFFYLSKHGVLFDKPNHLCKSKIETGWFKRSSLFMPRWASRITLEITGVRVERLQDISEEDAMAEGVIERHDIFHEYYQSQVDNVYRRGYAVLWESINGPGSWEINPWVWAIEFKRV